MPIDAKNTASRTFLIAMVIGCVLCAWFGIRWQIGTMLAERTSPADDNAAEIAGTAIRFAPLYSGGHKLLGSVMFEPAESLASYIDAARLSPFDIYRRIDLARAYELSGELTMAESEFQRAVELAPNYSAPRWHLANFLIRRGRESEALHELRAAAFDSRRYRDQAFSLVWDIYEKDPSRIEFVAGDRADAIAHAAYFFASRGAAEASLRNWDRLGAEDKKKNEKLARGIADGLYGQKRFIEAMAFFEQIGMAKAALNTISNGSFEDPISSVEDARFSWEIYRNEAKVEVGADTRVKRTGERSLRTTFRGYSKPAFYNIAQTVAVEPDSSYTLVFYVRAENLQSPGPPVVEVVDLINENALASSEPFAAGNYEWREFRLDFQTPSNCTGISIRTLRKFCGEECPISGTFWFDDMELIRK
ncbi:MAG: carbohydrate binding domain-containing protein [Acidobacteria bacterium]|nr:carbohydrate binding domain-containing protein [Acidobacteriota bacterium]